jgi:hypothetical protein
MRERGGTNMTEAEEEETRDKDRREGDLVAKNGLIPTGDIQTYIQSFNGKSEH